MRVTNILTIASSLFSAVLGVYQQSLWSLVISLPLVFFAAGVWINREAQIAVASILLDQVRYEMECASEERREEFMRLYEEFHSRHRKWWRV